MNDIQNGLCIIFFINLGMEKKEVMIRGEELFNHSGTFNRYFKLGKQYINYKAFSYKLQFSIPLN